MMFIHFFIWWRFLTFMKQQNYVAETERLGRRACMSLSPFSRPTALVRPRWLTPAAPLQDAGSKPPRRKQLRQLSSNKTRRLTHVDPALSCRRTTVDPALYPAGASRWFPAPPLRRVFTRSRRVETLARR